MTEEIKKDPLDDKIINLSVTVSQLNQILHILGNAPYLLSANLIAYIRMQGEPQFKALLEAEKKKNESKATT
jgi:hypothetical protein